MILTHKKIVRHNYTFYVDADFDSHCISDILDDRKLLFYSDYVINNFTGELVKNRVTTTELVEFYLDKITPP